MTPNQRSGKDHAQSATMLAVLIFVVQPDGDLRKR
jgi:hypothetical protein